MAAMMIEYLSLPLRAAAESLENTEKSEGLRRESFMEMKFLKKKKLQKR